jgi:hypothetical protein
MRLSWSAMMPPSSGFQSPRSLSMRFHVEELEAEVRGDELCDDSIDLRLCDVGRMGDRDKFLLSSSKRAALRGLLREGLLDSRIAQMVVTCHMPMPWILTKPGPGMVAGSAGVSIAFHALFSSFLEREETQQALADKDGLPVHSWLAVLVRRGAGDGRHVLDADHGRGPARLGPTDDATAVTAAQLRDLVERLIAAGQWQPGEPDIVIVTDAGYDVTRLAWVLRDLPVE